MKKFAAIVMCLGLWACQRTPGEVVEKVLVDWGVKEEPEGYVTGSDRVFERLREVGRSEMRRMNYEARHGEVKFQEDAGIGGKFYKEVKVYEDCRPVDVRARAKSSKSERGYVGFIDYTYRIYQSARKSSRTEAEAETADTLTDIAGRDTYRYHFTGGGQWDGGEGELAKR
ncbi:MAG TPA: hypothetical protein HPP77_00325 [Candidatus Hydrogenedentes bacterium]|nr:hypothetical protein [Candidatus Hydrogenedentota bacterium]